MIIDVLRERKEDTGNGISASAFRAPASPRPRACDDQTPPDEKHRLRTRVQQIDGADVAAPHEQPIANQQDCGRRAPGDRYGGIQLFTSTARQDCFADTPSDK